MNSRVLKAACCTAYVISAILAVVFIIYVILSWIGYKELLAEPLIVVVPFSSVIKRSAEWFLMPSVVFAMLGYYFQKKSKK